MNKNSDDRRTEQSDKEKSAPSNVRSDRELTLVQGWLLVGWASGLLLFTWLCFSGTVSFGA